ASLRTPRRPGQRERQDRERRGRSDRRGAARALRSAERELPFRLLERQAGPNASEHPFDVLRGHLFGGNPREEKRRLDRGEPVPTPAARGEVFPEAPTLGRG